MSPLLGLLGESRDQRLTPWTRTSFFTQYGSRPLPSWWPKDDLAVGTRSMPGNPYDGHTLAETLEQIAELFGNGEI